MNTDHPDNVNPNPNGLAKALKFTIAFVTMLILLSAGLIIATVIVKKKTNSSASDIAQSIDITSSKQINSAFPSSCGPIDVKFFNDYIALYSKKCNIIKTIPIGGNHLYNIQF